MSQERVGCAKGVLTSALVDYSILSVYPDNPCSALATYTMSNQFPRVSLTAPRSTEAVVADSSVAMATAPTQSTVHVPLDRGSPLPLYAQVKRRMQAMIVSGDSPDDRFYSDQEMCAIFGVSRATIRQAIQELVTEGWLRRVQGQGTFVDRGKVDEAFSPAMNFLDQWAQAGRPLSVELRRFASLACGPLEARGLGIEPGTAALLIERARLRPSEGLVISYDYRYIHPDYAYLVDEASAAQWSLLDLLGRGVRLARGENRLEAGLAGMLGAEVLDVAEHAPVLIRAMTYFSVDDTPVMVGRSLYRADQVRCAFSVALNPGDADAVGPVATAAGTASEID